MRRKSERNKAKAASPEKEVERVTRKSTRRCVKQVTSTSPEQENVEEISKSVSNKVTEKKSAHVQRREVEQPEEQNEKILPNEADVKTKVQEDEEDNNTGSVWKVSRADASPGEIQKLKLSRQHNMSERLSDTSLNRKKSNKWQESGEGVAEEVDSADKQLVSCTRIPSSAEQPNDPSSSYPGQDSNEEVSDSKEILPETTSANLSDDKPNIDQQGESNEANFSNENADSEPIKSSDTTMLAPSSNGNRLSEETNQIIPKEEKFVEDTNEKTVEIFNKEASSGCVENTQKDSSSEDEDEKGKAHELNSSSESNDEIHAKSNRASGRIQSASRRKHRTKYRDSSNSDTADSDDEPSIIKRELEIDVYMQEEKVNVEDSHKQKDHSESPKARNNFLLNNMEMDVEHCEPNKQKLDSLTDKSEYPVTTTTQLVTYKPVKVNLKRSFSSRILTEKNDIKKEDNDANANNETGAPNKENHDSTEQDSKCAPRKRRWGTALSTDTAPSFSISTDSLKALVPGARPLSINEVRLSKDDDEDRDRFRVSEKWHNSTEGVNDNKSGDENILQKNGATKKGDPKIDNHIAARRKISIVKEVPHVKSPSPPATKPTNILLIKNLVRPFTLNQIKELLSRTGTIVENGFWMDRIKSKCFVEYANEDQAFETRQALHGISWPVSNPKRLHVEYATKDDMELARELSKDQSIPRKTEPLIPSDSWQQDWNREERTSTKVMVVREWDLGKEDGQQHIKEKEREKKEHDKKRRQRSRSPAVEAHLPAPARKFKKKEDEPPPAKLLDDLFRKTKATPCIYWLPLTNEQIVVKEEMRRQHMAEHARRLEEMRRAERNNRDGRRRRSPRK